MPKERGSRSSHGQLSPYSPCTSSSSRRGSKAKDVSEEWEQVRCPVCMDHPHNAVLLLCSSHKNGCRPFLCNTSNHLSNCLDQYSKSFSHHHGPHLSLSDSTKTTTTTTTTMFPCPLCRGLVSKWVVDDPARRYMDLKERACSVESCHFSGVYSELRRHAKADHPTARPSDVDPDRQRKWRTMERQRDLGDLFSMLNSEVDANNGSSLDGGMGMGMDVSLGPSRGGAAGGGSSLMVFFVGQSTVSHMLLRHRRSFSQSMMQFTTGPRAIVMWGERYSEGRTITDNNDNNGVINGDDNGVVDATNSSDNGELTDAVTDNPPPPPLQDNEFPDD